MESEVLTLNQHIAFELQQRFATSPQQPMTPSLLPRFATLSQVDFSWTVFKNKIYFARRSKSTGYGSSVTKLIQGLFEQYIDLSFFILRNRIYSTEKINEFSKAMVKLAAKRISGQIIPQNFEIKLTYTFEEILPEFDGDIFVHSSHRIGNDACFSVKDRFSDPVQIEKFLSMKISEIPRGNVLHDFNRKIAVAVIDDDGAVIEIATNQNFKNKTLHAEILLVGNLLNKGYSAAPKNWRLYASLKPCKMCAALLNEFFSDSEIYYFQEDPGPLAQNTLLDQNKNFKKLDGVLLTNNFHRH